MRSAAAATAVGVRSTVLDAFCNNYRVAVVEEATFDRLAVSHAIALFDIEQKYGDVVSLADATSYLSSRNENRRPA